MSELSKREQLEKRLKEEEGGNFKDMIKFIQSLTKEEFQMLREIAKESGFCEKDFD